MTNVRISQHMIQYPYTASPDHPVIEALEAMKEHGIRHLPVINDEDELVGIVSERDVKAARNLEGAEKLTVGDVMKNDVFVVSQNTSLSEVALEMAEGKIGSALVVDSDHDLIGIFTTTDALRLLSEMLESQSLEDYFLDEDLYEIPIGENQRRWVND